VIGRDAAIAFAMRNAQRSSPPERRICAISSTESSFTMLAALRPIVGSMRMSSGPSLRNAKPRSPPVKLGRADAEVEQHTGNGAAPVRCDDLRQRIKPAAMHTGPGPKWGKARCRRVDRIGVAVDADHRQAGVGSSIAAAVAGAAQRRVNNRAVGDGTEQLDNLRRASPGCAQTRGSSAAPRPGEGAGLCVPATTDGVGGVEFSIGSDRRTAHEPHVISTFFRKARFGHCFDALGEQRGIPDRDVGKRAIQHHWLAKLELRVVAHGRGIRRRPVEASR